MDRPLSDVLAWTKRSPVKLSKSDTVQAAAKVMSEQNVGSVLVVGGSATVGIVTEHDIMARVVAQGASASDTRLTDIMSADLSCIAADATVRDALSVMSDKRIRHLPVVRDAGVIGIVSMRDLVAWLSREREVDIDSLIQYIAGPAVRLDK